MKQWVSVLFSLVLAGGVLAGCSNSSSGSSSGNSMSNMPGMGQSTMNMGSEQKSDQASAFQTSWKLSEEKPSSGKDVKLTIQVSDRKGQPIQDFETEMTKKMHLIVVSKDLSYFAHIHPEYKGNGTFTISTAFPSGGDFELIADFTPKGSEGTHAMHWVQVNGTPTQQEIVVDQELTKTVDGKLVTLSFDKKLAANQPMMMTFHLTDAATKKPITNLEPYLGTVGHVVILSSDAKQYLHVHPMDATAKGPDAVFHTEFPSSGVYKLWLQFQHQGKVVTVPFVVQVP